MAEKFISFKENSEKEIKEEFAKKIQEKGLGEKLLRDYIEFLNIYIYGIGKMSKCLYNYLIEIPFESNKIFEIVKKYKFYLYPEFDKDYFNLLKKLESKKYDYEIWVKIFEEAFKKKLPKDKLLKIIEEVEVPFDFKKKVDEYIFLKNEEIKAEINNSNSSQIKENEETNNIEDQIKSIHEDLLKEIKLVTNQENNNSEFQELKNRLMMIESQKDEYKSDLIFKAKENRELLQEIFELKQLNAYLENQINELNKTLKYLEKEIEEKNSEFSDKKEKNEKVINDVINDELLQIEDKDDNLEQFDENVEEKFNEEKTKEIIVESSKVRELVNNQMTQSDKYNHLFEDVSNPDYMIEYEGENYIFKNHAPKQINKLKVFEKFVDAFYYEKFKKMNVKDQKNHLYKMITESKFEEDVKKRKQKIIVYNNLMKKGFDNCLIYRLIYEKYSIEDLEEISKKTIKDFEQIKEIKDLKDITIISESEEKDNEEDKNQPEDINEEISEYNSNDNVYEYVGEEYENNDDAW